MVDNACLQLLLMSGIEVETFLNVTSFVKIHNALSWLHDLNDHSKKLFLVFHGYDIDSTMQVFSIESSHYGFSTLLNFSERSKFGPQSRDLAQLLSGYNFAVKLATIHSSSSW